METRWRNVLAGTRERNPEAADRREILLPFLA